MRTSAAIKERLQQNALRLRAIQQRNPQLSRVQEIEVEYLQMEARTFEEMLGKLNNTWWKSLLAQKPVRFVLALLGMSLYVMAISNIFSNMNLSQVEQWEFIVTALPFWLIFALIPAAFLALIISKDHRD